MLEMITAEKNRLRRTTPGVRHRIEVNLQWLEEQLKELDLDLGDFLKSSPMWQKEARMLGSAPGVGPVVTTTLIARLPELGSLNCKQVSTLAIRGL